MAALGRHQNFRSVSTSDCNVSGAAPHELCARLVARMFTFWAKKIA
ncbi:hypothetical protein GOB27_27660 [Sinorhizobium meliloti]|nr:hypothetical protein [Sinorhizobium meliloti]